VLTCGHEHDTRRSLWQTLVGVVFVINAFIVDWLFEQGHVIASGSGFVGAVILGYPNHRHRHQGFEARFPEHQ